ncbi:MAG TPA: TIGR03986 family CRISPR-associated RAMP protein [Kiritimatiellia bacterium]|nr:TIGR03986 family CRISPR-associated RAMP protein [Kiritimatiellia bacterium]HMO98497.1 TIGR03986 family CRISPR-associated RAMP protein [Kiritimatiellia bacterium]HMP95805.1 TIGR03986 family CRISPR-associated RAMP protein [Kiritimatiellia bacterium]
MPNPPLDYIPSPYYFVPLAEKVNAPPDAQSVSMDVPFKDGINGWLELEVTAKTPIYIRNGGHYPEDNATRLEMDEYKNFYQVYPGGPYAIPGTSIKGAIRNVLEIATFSRLNRVDNHRYSVRDLRNPDRKLYLDHMSTDTTPYTPKVKAGWLSINASRRWTVEPCSFARVEQSDIESLIRKHKSLGRKQELADKYAQMGNQLEVFFNVDPKTVHINHSCGPLCYTRVTQIRFGGPTDSAHPLKGKLVLTGQPSNRSDKPNPGKSRGKHMEFIFYNDSNDHIDVEHIRREFEFVHSTASDKPNDQWRFWRGKLMKDGRVPVFYLEENRSIVSMGLAMMYRLPYKHTIHDAIQNTSSFHLEDPGKAPDFADTLLGYVTGEKALRGRIQFEPLLADENAKTIENIPKTVLGGPKPSYYPNYIEQKSNQDGRLKGNYQTLMHEKSRIRGWKRYVVRTSPLNNQELPKVPLKSNGRENLDVATTFRPLEAGTAFRGRVYFHNLRPHELGALTWVLTWGGKEKHCHQIGMAKPLGFGAVTIKVDADKSRLVANEPSTSPPDLNACMESFVQVMDGIVGEKTGSWMSSPQMKELLALADPARSDRIDSERLRYPVLDPGANTNDFSQAKDKRNPPLCLLQYTEIPQNKTPVTTSTKGVGALKPMDLSPIGLFINRLTRKEVSHGNIPKEVKKLISQKPDITEASQLNESLIAFRNQACRKRPPYGTNPLWEATDILEEYVRHVKTTNLSEPP